MSSLKSILLQHQSWSKKSNFSTNIVYWIFNETVEWNDYCNQQIDTYGFFSKILQNFHQKNFLEKFAEKVGRLNGAIIDAKHLASNFAIEAFTTASFSMSMTSDEPIAVFDKVRD